MTEFEIKEIARLLHDRDEWECKCEGCKYLGTGEWHFREHTGRAHYCTHPDRQGGFSDPRPYGCGGKCFER